MGMDSPERLPSLDEECFFIAPIGHDGSPERDRSDGVLDFVVAPAAGAHGLTVVRADQIVEPGQITRQVIEHIVGARAAVVDLTGANPNVYYEMAIRHTAELPTVLIAEVGEQLPFDIAQMRTIFFDHTNLKSANQCTRQIERHLAEALAGEVESPVTASADVSLLRKGGEEQRTLADLVERVEILSALVSDGERGIAQAAAAVTERADALGDLVAAERRSSDQSQRITPNVGPALVRFAELFDELVTLRGAYEEGAEARCLDDIRALLHFVLLTVPPGDFANMKRQRPQLPPEAKDP